MRFEERDPAAKHERSCGGGRGACARGMDASQGVGSGGGCAGGGVCAVSSVDVWRGRRLRRSNGSGRVASVAGEGLLLTILSRLSLMSWTMRAAGYPAADRNPQLYEGAARRMMWWTCRWRGVGTRRCPSCNQSALVREHAPGCRGKCWMRR